MTLDSKFNLKASVCPSHGLLLYEVVDVWVPLGTLPVPVTVDSSNLPVRQLEVRVALAMTRHWAWRADSESPGQLEPQLGRD